jgi:predicted small secreted protein
MLMRVIVSAAFLASAGCNTVEGIGKDLSAVGGSVSKSASTAKAGKTQVITRDPAACLPDAHGKVPSGPCVTRTTTVRAKTPPRPAARTTAANSSSPAQAQLDGEVTPVKSEASPVKAQTRTRSGWWQPSCEKPGAGPCSRPAQ